MPSRANCPDAQTLNQFASGELADGDADSIGEHLQLCSICTVLLRSMPANDTLVISLVRAHRAFAIDVEDRAALVQLMARLNELPQRQGSSSGSQYAQDTTSNMLGNSSIDSVQLDLESRAELDRRVAELLSPPEFEGELGRLGAYRVKSILGSGGMGVVFEAEDTQLGRAVALKVMQPGSLHRESNRRRFLREARSVAALEHVHIISIYHVGEERGVPYFVMPLLNGESLDSRIRRAGQLSVSEAIHIGRQIALGLAAAHHRGLVHRDIKPANVWLEKMAERSSLDEQLSTNVKILDFGLARDEREYSQLTQSGAIAGTPAFMAPEQALGEPTDARSDLFSLGCVLYYACSGKLPFTGRSNLAVMMAVMNHHPPPLRNSNPNVPVGLDSLVMRLLHKEPSQRFQTATEVVGALRSVADGDEPLESGSATRSATLDDSNIRRNTIPLSRRWVALSTIVACLCAVVLWQVWRWSQSGRVPSATSIPGVKRMLPESFGNRGPRVNDRPESGIISAFPGLEPRPTALRGFRRWQIETKLPRGEIFALAWDSKGKRVAVGSPNGYVRILTADKSELLQIMPAHRGSVWSMDWSTTGEHLVSAGEDGLVRLYDSDGRWLHDLGRHLGLVRTIEFSPDGRWVASAGWDSKVRLWKNTGEAGPVFEGHSKQIDSVAWHPSGTKLASASWDGSVRLWNLDGSDSSELKGRPGREAVLGLAWSPDGKLLATASVDGMIRLYTENGLESSVWQGHESSATSIAWSASDVLAAGSQDGKIRLWRRDATLIQTQEFGPGRINGLTWTDAGDRLAIIAGDYTIRFLDQAGKPIGAISVSTEPVRSVAWSNTGELASAGDDSTVRTWNADGTQNQISKGHASRVYSVSWHRMGNRLVSSGADMAVRVWDLVRNKVDILNGYSPVAWNPIGEDIAWSFGQEIQLGAPGATPRPLRGHKSAVYGLAWNSAGTRLASSDANGEIRIWNQDGVSEQVWQANPLVTSLAWHPKQPLLASGSGGTGDVQLWSLDGQLRSTLQGHIKGVLSLAWSPDGERLLSSSYDQSVRVWNRDGLPVGTLTSAMAIGTAVCFDATGQRIATSHTDGTIHVWDGTSLEPVWTTQLFSDGNWVRFNSSREPLSSSPSILDSHMVVVGEDDLGVARVLKLSDLNRKGPDTAPP